ncbi:MAG: hypothetical protein ABI183_00540 [Polyangiaceae bacterium]
MKTRWLRVLIVAAIALSGPMSLGLDFTVRAWVLGGQSEEVVAFFANHVTPFAWCVVPLPILGGIAGFRWYPTRFRKSLERWQRDRTVSVEQAASRADLEALFLTTTLAQFPAVFGDLSIILGARLTPALCSTTASVIAVLAIATLAPRRR